ncbi:MAG TPA: hypothetical protein VGF55_29735 [Gemmataceae bacterium]|jgi:hypothetical protein
MSTASHPDRFSDWPLWRLLVALADAERQTGPDSSTTHAYARAVSLRLRGRELPAARQRKGAADAR